MEWSANIFFLKIGSLLYVVFVAFILFKMKCIRLDLFLIVTTFFENTLGSQTSSRLSRCSISFRAHIKSVLMTWPLVTRLYVPAASPIARPNDRFLRSTHKRLHQGKLRPNHFFFYSVLSQLASTCEKTRSKSNYLGKQLN